METVNTTYRNVKDIDHTKFCYFLETTITSSKLKDQSLNKFTKIYNEVLTAALDKFVPKIQGKSEREINYHGSTESTEMESRKEENWNENGRGVSTLWKTT